MLLEAAAVDILFVLETTVATLVANNCIEILIAFITRHKENVRVHTETRMVFFEDNPAKY